MVLDEALQRWMACLSLNATAACQLTAGDGWLVLGLVGVVLLVGSRRAQARHGYLDLASYGMDAHSLSTRGALGEST